MTIQLTSGNLGNYLTPVTLADIQANAFYRSIVDLDVSADQGAIFGSGVSIGQGIVLSAAHLFGDISPTYQSFSNMKEKHASFRIFRL